MRNKRLLHETLARPLPRAAVDRPKQGFTLPFARWMGGELAAVRPIGHGASRRGRLDCADGAPDDDLERLAARRGALEPAVGARRARRVLEAGVIAHADMSITRRLRPSQGWNSRTLSDIWAYRELLYFLVWRDIKVRYKQTLLGAGWAIIQPLLTMVVFTLFFGRLAKVPSDGIAVPALLADRRSCRGRSFASALAGLGSSLVSGISTSSRRCTFRG